MRRIVMLILGVVALGIFVLPATISIFAGQHVWYNISGDANEIPCNKCHTDVYDEMSSLANGAHTRMSTHCEFCHRTCFNNTYNRSSGKYEPSSSITYASGDGSGSSPGKEAHAAATIECMDCHGVYKDGGNWNHWDYPEYNSGEKCHICHHGGGFGDFISAGGFGFGTTDDDDPDKNPNAGRYAAHKKFVLEALNNSLLEGADEACIACHTHMRAVMNFNVTSGIHITVNNSYNTTSSCWNITELETSDYTTYKEVKS